MANNFKISDLGVFEKKFTQILEQQNLSYKGQLILGILISAIFGRILPEALADALIEALGIEFDQAVELAYDLKIEILDNKEALEKIKNTLEQKTELKFAPQSISDEFLAGLKNYKIKDESLHNRFDQAILSWLKGVRDLAELKATLTKSEKIGGIGMPEEVFDQLYDLLIAKDEEIKSEHVNIAEIIEEYEGSKMPAETAEVEPDIEIDVPGKIKQLPVKEKLTGSDVTLATLSAEKNIGTEELARKEEILKQLKAQQSPIKPAREEGDNLIKGIEAEEKFLEAMPEIKAPAMPQPVVAPMPKPQPVPLKPVSATASSQPTMKKVSSSRPMMEDIKFSPQLYSLTDELAALKIEDFRRLSKEPNEAAQKIRAKLDLLEDESIMKKVDGIKALKSSPLYKIYAGIMNRSIREGKSFDQVISANPQISLAEFKAIMELNKSLKY